jgi:acyl-CoA thioesterase-1
MNGVRLACTLAVLVAAASASGPSAARAEPRSRVVVLGDSLTSGRGIGVNNAFPAVLQRKMDAEGLAFDVVNAGVSGATSSDGVRRLGQALEGNVRILVVALGANDGLRGVPIERLTSNLSRIIGEAQSRGVTVLLCGMDALPLYGWNYTVSFHKTFPALAERYDVPLVPFMLQGVIGNDAMMQADHIHPNVDGARRIAENIWPYLRPLVQGAAATN